MTRPLDSVVRRAAARLRLLPVVDGVADKVLSVIFDPANREGTTEAITALAHAVEDERPRALVRLLIPKGVEYAKQDRGGRVRVVQMFVMFPREGQPRMEARLFAGIAK